MKHYLGSAPDSRKSICYHGILTFIFALLSSIAFSQDQHEIDSLEKYLPTITVDCDRIEILNELASQTVDIDPAKSIKYAETAMNISEACGDQRNVANSLLNIGNGHYNLAEFKVALSYYLRSLHIQEGLKNKKGMLTAAGSIGNVFLDMRQPDQALKYFKQSLALGRELNNKRGIASSLISIGTVYSEKNDYKNALDYCLEALKIFQEIGYKEAAATCMNNIADNYNSLKDYPKAMVYVTKAYETYREIGNVYGMSLALNNLGNFYQSTGYPEKAIEYYTRGLEQAKQIGAGDRIVTAYKGLSDSYKAMGRYKEALDANEKFQKINDSIFNIDNSKQIAEMQTRFETEKKAKEIDLLMKDKMIKEDELLRQRLITWTTAIGGIIVLLLALLAIRANIQKRKVNKELKVKNQKIETAYNIIEDQHKDIKDSIRYAERLQKAILPTHAFNKIFGNNSFVLYKPKDIVSGDFYWIETLGKENFNSGSDLILLAAVDCTGHGVPGAFMSIVGHNLLKQAVKEHHKIKPSEILNELNQGLSETLRQTMEDSTVKDGMDIALCSLQKNDSGSYTLQFAGANNPVWIIRNQSQPELEEIKGDKYPIGMFLGEELHQFQNRTVELFKGDSVYVFTDGYADQFGGEKGKKFKYKPLQNLLLSIQNQTMEEQKNILDQTISAWKGNLEQVDDILIVGIKI
jgi:serine phosphatase RsbU (regulator of sigma subunit)/TPR repeat protein